MTLGLAVGEVRLHEAHDAWARAFELERATIVAAIGPYILDVQHVGSTAVPGVPAKPILDVLVGVADFEEARVCVAPLERVGYLFRGEHGIPRRHYFVKGEPRTHHLHMIERDSEKWRSTVGFRDLLTRDPESARAYADAKRTLAAVYSRDRDAYQREKGKVVENLLDAAAKRPATDTDRVLREQAEYYRARAPEYDQWWFREGRYDRGLTAQWRADAAAVAEALATFGPRGRVLELACGTGIWSERLLPFAADLTALDASPEMLALNAARLGSAGNVRYVAADLFRWEPTERFDVVFFGFWLSHVPPERFEAFWNLVRRCLAPGGRVFFVDSRREETSTAADHRLPPAHSHSMQRRLNDGREFEIVKIFYDPKQLAERLSSLGWQFNIRDTERYFICGDGAPSPRE